MDMLKRREFFRLSLLAALVGITGCGKGLSPPIISAASETLPQELLKALPTPWVYKPLEITSRLGLSQLVVNSSSDLFAIGDGWIPELSKESIQPITAQNLSSRFSRQAQEFLESFGHETSKRVFPIGVSPWVILFRNGHDLLSRAQDGWNILLDPDLTGRLVLPESPRVIISLADRIEEADGLRKLREQALTLDDRNSLNWVLSGKARAAILPLSRCFNILSRDPRLSVVVPKSGAPLHWTVLVSPLATTQPFPDAWLEAAWTNPLLGKLLARGWVPPLPYSELLEAIDYIPDSYKKIVLPPELVWQKSWSFSPLTEVERNRLESLWIQSTP